MRYLATIALAAPDEPGEEGRASSAARAARLSRQLAHPRVHVWSDAPAACAAEPGRLVLGTIYYDPDASGHCPVPGPGQLAEFASPDLVRTCWGNFVAIFASDRAVELARPPFGTLPVLFARAGSMLVVASDVALLRACGCEPGAVDWFEMARHLAAPYVRTYVSGLTGVQELRGGTMLSVARGRIAVAQVWNPWHSAWRARQAAPPEQGQRAVRHAVDACTAAITGTARHRLLLLSGGLDSSILAAALRRSNRAFSALTFTTIEPSGDERRYARSVADALAFDLAESERCLDRVDVARSNSAILPYPSHRSFQQDSRAATSLAAESSGAELIVEGGGGDNVFCSLQSVTPVVDKILAHEPWRKVWRSACDLAQLTDVSAGILVLGALLRLQRKDLLRVTVDTSFLTQSAAEIAHSGPVHPWLVTPKHAWPGSAAHIALLVVAQGWAESFDPFAPIPTVCPLLSRPVVEACLAVPSWQWFSGGQNRVVAREAFRGRLPDAIVDRRSKATPDSFVTRLFEHNRAALRELLLDGLLVANGVVERSALEQVLDDPGPARDHRHRRLMRIADAEAWARAQA